MELEIILLSEKSQTPKHKNPFFASSVESIFKSMCVSMQACKKKGTMGGEEEL